MLLFVCIFAWVTVANGLDNGLAKTPPMGWLSWQRFRCNTNCDHDPENCISEKLYKDMAYRMAHDGYKEVGYEYINIDDCWAEKERDSELRLVADKKRFPNGMKALADYVHSLGLKLGIYGDFGLKTCGGYPGSKFFMQKDAETFASWGIDSLKLDACYTSVDDIPVGYTVMERYMNLTGRHMLFSCSWPAYVVAKRKTPNYSAIARSCNLWRNFDDIDDDWDSIKNIVNYYAKDAGNFSAVAGPGNFNDPDMLIIGNFGLSYYQERAQMAMWAIMAAPLLMSNDLRNIRPDSKAILQNKRVISINQDRLGIQGRKVAGIGNIQIWMKPLYPNGNAAFAILNLNNGGSVAKLQLTPKQVGLTDPIGYKVADAFTGTVVGNFTRTSALEFSVNPSDVFLGIAVLL